MFTNRCAEETAGPEKNRRLICESGAQSIIPAIAMAFKTFCADLSMSEDLVKMLVMICQRAFELPSGCSSSSRVISVVIAVIIERDKHRYSFDMTFCVQPFLNVVVSVIYTSTESLRCTNNLL